MLYTATELVLHEYTFAVNALEYVCAALSVRLGGYQPHYFPRLHCIARMLDSDVSPIADYVQYVRKHAFPGPDGIRVNGPSYQAQTPIKTRDGILLLGVPVVHTGKRQCLNEAAISYDTPWPQKHLNIIEQHYRAAPHFEVVFPELRALLERRYATLAELAAASMAWSIGFLFGLDKRDGITIRDIQTALPREGCRMKTVALVSETEIPPPDKNAGRDANDWIIDMCRHFGAREYYFGGTSAAAYMDLGRFEEAGITLVQQDWRCRGYPQLHGAFAANLSIIDLLMNVPPEEARSILYTPASNSEKKGS